MSKHTFSDVERRGGPLRHVETCFRHGKEGVPPCPIEMHRFDATRRFLPSLSRQKVLRVTGGLLVVMDLGERVALCLACVAIVICRE